MVHDWFISVGGAEKVLHQLLEIYPDADVFCLLDYFDDRQRSQILNGKKTKTSRLQRVPFSKRYYRKMIPFFYRAIEHLDVSDYDIIVSSSHAVAKGIKKQEGQTHFCYCHTPVRYVWNMKKTYLAQIPEKYRGMAMRQLGKMKKWDLKTAEDVDYFIANSKFVAERIQKNYGKESVVVSPPVDTDFYQVPTLIEDVAKKSPYYLVVSRLVHYKRVDLIVEAFNEMPDKKLIVIGDGPQKEALTEMANENVEFLGYQSKKEVRKYMQHAEAMVLAAIEDFGITSLETQACGTPVIAFNYGGYKETVVHNETGLLFDKQCNESIKEAVGLFAKRKEKFSREAARKNAERFQNKRFRTEIRSFIEAKLAEIDPE